MARLGKAHTVCGRGDVSRSGAAAEDRFAGSGAQPSVPAQGQQLWPAAAWCWQGGQRQLQLQRGRGSPCSDLRGSRALSCLHRWRQSPGPPALRKAGAGGAARECRRPVLTAGSGGAAAAPACGLTEAQSVCRTVPELHTLLQPCCCPVTARSVGWGLAGCSVLAPEARPRCRYPRAGHSRKPKLTSVWSHRRDLQLH